MDIQSRVTLSRVQWHVESWGHWESGALGVRYCFDGVQGE